MTELTRDEFGAVTQSKDPLGKVQRFEYDSRGNQTAQIDALGRAVRTEHDASGNAVRTTDASGTSATSTYDGAGRLASIAAPGLGTTRLEYDDEGQLTAMIDAAGGTTRYSYDALGRRTGVTDQLGRTTVTDYDVLGRKTLTTDRQGAATTYEYDAMSRLVKKTIGGAATTYGYDGAGRVTAAENADARVTTTFDAADHPTRFATTLAGSTAAQAVDYTYDSAGRRASMAYGGVTDSYAYDAGGRLATLTSSQAGAFRFAYDAVGRKTSLQRPNGVTTTYAYDVSDQITAIVHAKGAQTLDESRYSYDAAGRRTVVKQFDGDHAFGYDAAGRVTSADHPAGQADESFAYDDLGNRTGGGEQYDAANKLLSRSGYTYQYDEEGRTTARTETATGKVTRFGWDGQGRLRSVTLPSGAVTGYRYDPLGRRIETTKAGQSRVQVYGLDPNAVAESTGGGASTRYTFGVGYDTPLAMRRGTATTFFAQDALSSVTSLMDQSGAVTGRYRYDTYGQITGTTGGATSPYTYTGREWDEGAGIYDYRARAYDPATGRFLSEDPVPGANLYPYANSSPTTLNDPAGRFASFGELAETAAVQGVISGIVSAGFRFARCGNSGLAGSFGRGFAAGFIFGTIGKVGGSFLKELAKKSPSVAAQFTVPFVAGTAALLLVPAQIVGNWSGAIDAEDPYGWYAQAIISGVGSFAPDQYGLIVDAVAASAGQAVPWGANPGDTEEDCG